MQNNDFCGGLMEQVLTQVNRLDYSSGHVQWYRSRREKERACVTRGLVHVTSREWVAVHWFSDRRGLHDTV